MKGWDGCQEPICVTHYATVCKVITRRQPVGDALQTFHIWTQYLLTLSLFLKKKHLKETRDDNILMLISKP